MSVVSKSEQSSLATHAGNPCNTLTRQKMYIRTVLIKSDTQKRHTSVQFRFRIVCGRVN